MLDKVLEKKGKVNSKKRTGWKKWTSTTKIVAIFLKSYERKYSSDSFSYNK